MTDPANPTLDPRFGAVSPEVTQWSAHRIVPNGSIPLGHPDADGVVCHRWPLADLSIQTLRDRWGAGRYRCNWYGAVGGKTSTHGKSPIIEFGDNAAAETGDDDGETGDGQGADAYTVIERIQARADKRAASELERTLTLMRTLQGAAGPPTAAPLPDAERAELERLRAENADLRARQMVREETERAVAPLRAELERRDRRIAELENTGDDGPDLDLDSPIARQLVGVAIQAALKNPEPIMGLVSTILEKVAQAKATPPPTPNPAPHVPQVTAHVSRETSAPVRPLVQPFPKAPEADADPSPYGKPEPINPGPVS